MAHNNNSNGNQKSYLEQLSFNPSLWKGWAAKYITNIRLVLLSVIAITILGIYSFITLPTRLNPEIKIPIVSVVTALPGAGPQDVESLLTIPIEDELAGVEGLTNMTSTSRENVSAIVLEFASTVDGDKAREDVQTIVDTVNDLPEDAEDPNVQLFDFEDQPIWTFALSVDGNLPSLMSFAQHLDDRLEGLGKVDRVETSGFEQSEIQVVVRPEKMQEYDLSVPQLAQAVRTATSSFPAGTVDTSGSSFSLAIDPSAESIAQIRNIRLTVDTNVLRLGDIAEVSERPLLNQTKSYLASPDIAPVRAVTFFVYKTSSADIADAGTDVKKMVEEELKAYPQFKLISIENTSELITEQFAELVEDFRDSILLVFIMLLIFLGFRQALIACFAIPLTFLASFFAMQLFNLSINFLTLFSLLLSLGVLVDDAIVIVQAMTEYYRSKKFTSQETGILVWRDFLIPVISSNITTVWAFVPLLLASGIIGEFIKSIPIVVTSTIISSTAIALLVTLPIMIFVLNPKVPGRVKILMNTLFILALVGAGIFLIPRSPLLPVAVIAFVALLLVIRLVSGVLAERVRGWVKGKPRLANLYNKTSHGFSNGFVDMTKVSAHYKKVLNKVVHTRRWRRVVIITVVIFSLFSYALLPAGFIVNEFFPAEDQTNLYVNIELPSGTNTETVDVQTQKLMEEMRKLPEVLYVTGENGRSYNVESGGGGGNQNTALITLKLKEMEDRKRTSMQLAVDLRRQYDQYLEADVKVTELSSGPPAGSALQIKLLGEDLNQLDGYAEQIIGFLEKTEGVVNPDKSLKPGTSKIVFVPDYDKLAAEEVTVDTLGGQLRAFASGVTLDTLKVEGEEKDIVFRMATDSQSPAALTNLQIRAGESTIPLTALGRLELETNPTVINRENQRRTISVSAGVAQGYTAPAINPKLEEFADSLNLPNGYNWQTGGINEENTKSVQSILMAMILAFTLIFATLVIEFGSFRQAIIVLLVIPLAVSGVFIMFALTGTPLSFPALIGVLALFGVVIKNSIMVVEKINQNQEEGMSFDNSLVDAAASRLEPIFLTSIITIIGLVPITLSDPLWRGLGGAVIAGLMFSGSIMLFFIPVVYYMWFNPKDQKS